MDEMTLEQKRAVAMASARLRLQQQGGNQSFTNDGTVGPTIARGGTAMQPDGSVNSENVMRTMIDSMPVAGRLLTKAGAAIDATLDDTPIGSHAYPGKSWDERYHQAYDDGQGKRDAFANQHPYASTAAGLTGGVLGTLPMLAAAPEAAGLRLGSGLLGRSAISAGTGAVVGGADAGVRSDFDPEKMKYGAISGLLGGAVAPAAGQIVGGAIGKGVNAVKAWNTARNAGLTASALRYLAEKAGQDGLSGSAIQQHLDELGPEAMWMDLGPNLKGTASALANHPGEGQAIIKDALTSRHAGANARIQSGIDDALGPVTGPRSINDAVREGQRATGPAYEDSFKQAVPVDTSHIANHLETQSTILRGPAQSAAKNIRNMLNVNNGNTLDTNPYTLLQTRNAIDGLQKNEANPQVSRILTETRQMIDDSLAQHVPGIKMADAQFRELARQNEGLRIGVKALDSGREALRPEELHQEVLDGVNPEGLMVGPSAKTFRMQQAARADIDRQIGTKANDLVALKNIIKGEGDWNRDRMGTLFGQDQTKSALDLLDREALFATTKHDVVDNSFTAARQAAQKELAPPAPPAFGVKEAYSAQGSLGALRAAGVKTVGHVMKLIQQQAIEKRNTQIAQALSSNRPAYAEALNLMQHMKVGAPQVQKVIEAITMDRATKGGNMTHQLLSRLESLAN